MHSSNENIAILFFSRTVSSERAVKPVFNSKNKNECFHKALKEKSLAEAHKTTFPIFHFTERNQKGKTFGEKLANAFQTVFDEGFEKVISIGSDCPDLKVANIEKAATLLEDSNLVLGPDRRGGTYLIALSKKVFKKEVFGSLAWQSPQLLASFISQANSEAVTVQFLETKFDINNCEDVNTHLRYSITLKEILRLIFEEEFQVLTYKQHFPHTPPHFYQVKHRGPPSLPFN